MAKPLSESEIQKFDWISFSRDPFEIAERLLATIDQDRARRAELATIRQDRERIAELEADIARRQRNDQIWWQACRCAEHPDVNARANNMWGCPDCLELIKHDNAQLKRQLAESNERIVEMETALRAARSWIVEILREENEPSPENTHTIRMIDAALAKAEASFPEGPKADLPSIEDICGLWEDEKEPQGG